MDRNAILNGFENLSVSEYDYLCEVLDHYEGIFNDITNHLKEINIDNLDNIVTAKSLAEEAGNDLY